ncbi:tautomerase family protein [Carnimonas bestiolae]|uniref:tautomerase family protein n=1 Tax=Carnimonas bestiolae TaxID=3402172 RepID=UPI003EDC3C26
MPLIRFDLIEGRSDEELATLLDAAHEAMLEAFKVPAGDRYQLVYQHKPAAVRIEDTGLGIERTQNVLIVSITTRPRTREEKVAFNQLLVEKLEQRCGIASSDVMINYVTNSDEDWSFGHGEAQFLTGKL